MSWQQTFLETFGTGGLGGMSFRTWIRALAENRYSIDRPYWLRAGVTTASSLQNSFYKRIEALRFENAIEATKVQPPVFVLGLWRSGTTHLHNLLAQDERFAYPNTYQVFFPHTFLTTESWNARLLDFLLPERRVQDNVKLGADQPQEDDFAVCGMTGMSFMMSIAFPRRAAEYCKYITLKKATSEERANWQSAMLHFLKKLTYKYNRPLVLKSPAHTAHVRELLQIVPQREIRIDSSRSARGILVINALLQQSVRYVGTPEIGRLRHHRLHHSNYREVTEKYFDERSLIPEANLIEIPFTQLDAQPLETMREIYGRLALPSFGHIESKLQSYLKSLGTYRKNRHTDLPPEIQSQLADQWQAYIHNWGYDERLPAAA